MQDVPSDIPMLVKPSGDKVDIDAFYRSIPKYSTLSADHKSWWQHYLYTLETAWSNFDNESNQIIIISYNYFMTLCMQVLTYVGHSQKSLHCY